jgi:hypothetical protein
MHLIKLFLLFTLLLGWGPAEKEPEDSYRIPLKRAGRLLYMEAIVDGQIGNLIFDSGASGLVLNQAYFTDYQVVYDAEAGGISGSAGPLYRKKVGELNLGPLVMKDLRANVTHLGHIENKRGIKVLGLLGISLLEDYEIILDMRNNSLELVPLDAKGSVAKEPLLKKAWDEILPIDYLNRIVSLRLVIAGKKVPVCLDTAAEMSYLDSRCGDKVLQEVNILRTVNLSGAGTSRIEVLYGELRELQIGKRSLPDFPLLIGPMKEMNQAYGLSLKGMLGFDFLQMTVLKINLKNETMAIRWNPDPTENPSN